MKNSIKICLLAIFMLFACASCTASCKHTGNATCSKEATCTTCGETYLAPHKWVAGEVTKEATCYENGKQIYTCECGATKIDVLTALVHNYSVKFDGENHWDECVCGDKLNVTEHAWEYSHTVDPKCVEAGKDVYKCACGAIKESSIDALGHSFAAEYTYDENNHWHVCHCNAIDTEVAHEFTVDSVVTPGTCTTDGLQIVKCICGFSKEEIITAQGHKYEKAVIAPTCTAAGKTVYTCSCGDKYEEAGEPKLGHIDENLDIVCDREGCTSKVAPKADSHLSLAVANLLGANLSTSNQYYVTGKIVEFENEPSGIFWIEDDAGDRFYIRIPKDKDGLAYSNWKFSLVLNDVVTFYGKINKFSSSGNTIPSMQSAVLYELEHVHTYGPATCFEAATCVCRLTTGEPLGHIDENGDILCDRCNWDTTIFVADFSYNTNLYPGVYPTDKTSITYTQGDFVTVIEKNTSSNSVYTTASTKTQVYKNQKFTLTSTLGKNIVSLSFEASSASYVANLQTLFTTLGYEYTTEGNVVTISGLSGSEFSFVNSTTKTIYIKSIQILYK